MYKAELPRRVLLVEDDPDVSELYCFALTTAGHQVTLATDGEIAIEQIRQETFDVVLLDMMLPKLDGLGVLKEMRRLGVDTPTVVISNYNAGDLQAAAMRAGARRYLVKSHIQPSDLVALVSQQ